MTVVGRWILVSACGWTAGLATGVALSLAGEALVGLNPDRFLAFAALACLGAGVGLAQSIVIGPFLARPRNWLWATLAGHLVAMIVLNLPGFPNLPGPEILDDVILLALIGAAIGGAQWWVLRRRFRAAGLWAPATLLGYLGFLWIIIHPVSSPSQFVLAGAAPGAAASVLPGVVLAWLVARERPGAAPSGAQISCA